MSIRRIACYEFCNGAAALRFFLAGAASRQAFSKFPQLTSRSSLSFFVAEHRGMVGSAQVRQMQGLS